MWPAGSAARAIAAEQTGAKASFRDWRTFPLPPDLEPYRAEVPDRLPPRHDLDAIRASEDPVSAATAVLATASYERERRYRKAVTREEAAQCDLYRDLFAHPAPLPKFPRRWRTSTVTAMARQMYEVRDFSAMPILADALQDAGCEDAEILGHCRSDRPHVRGCWVVDLVLGNS